MKYMTEATKYKGKVLNILDFTNFFKFLDNIEMKRHSDWHSTEFLPHVRCSVCHDIFEVIFKNS